MISWLNGWRRSQACAVFYLSSNAAGVVFGGQLRHLVSAAQAG